MKTITIQLTFTVPDYGPDGLPSDVSELSDDIYFYFIKLKNSQTQAVNTHIFKDFRELEILAVTSVFQP